MAGLGRLDEARTAARALLDEKPGFTCEFARHKLFFVKDADQVSECLRLLETPGIPAS